MTNVFADAKREVSRARDLGSIDICKVIQVKDDAKHTARVQVRGDTGSKFVASVMTPTLGDVNVPPVGSIVAVAYAKGGRPMIIGTFYTTVEDVPSYKKNERIIGHTSTDTKVKIDADGNLTIEHHGGTTITVDSDGVTIDTDDTINLGGDSGNPVARQGDAVEVSDPDSGTITGTITGGSSKVNSE